MIVPVLNAQQSIGLLLDALEKQETRPRELVIVDNGCTDSTIEIVKSFAERSSFAVRVLEEETPGPSAARNRGLAETIAEILVFVDADCIPSPKWLTRILEHMDSGETVVCGPYQDSAPQGWIGRYIASYQTAERREARKVTAADYRNPLFLGGNMAWHRELLLQMGGFPVELRWGEDLEMGRRLLEKGTGFLYDPELSMEHRNHDTLRIRFAKAWSFGRYEARIVSMQEGPKVDIRFLSPLKLLLLSGVCLGLMPPLGWAGLVLLLGWALFRMSTYYERAELRIGPKEILYAPLLLIAERCVMELGRLKGSIEHKVLCF
ncbi:MAG: glycosyltransferase family 2 protein [Candidatus Omnitrophica bacterium]|nr:glycosyltransferase family 2 protein [Candidatus Omnitrophota bacterium]